jgi:hypothetical protein
MDRSREQENKLKYRGDYQPGGEQPQVRQISSSSSLFEKAPAIADDLARSKSGPMG